MKILHNTDTNNKIFLGKTSAAANRFQQQRKTHTMCQATPNTNHLKPIIIVIKGLDPRKGISNHPRNCFLLFKLISNNSFRLVR